MSTTPEVAAEGISPSAALATADGEERKDAGLRELFEKGVTLLRRLEGQGEEVPVEKQLDVVNEAVQIFQECSNKVRSLALFSSNEDLKEVNPIHIKYLLLEYYIGKTNTFVGNPKQRLGPLKASVLAFEAFLSTCKDYGLLSKTEEEMAAGEKVTVDRDALRQRFKEKQDLEGKMRVS